jgi:hypothetical protein
VVRVPQFEKPWIRKFMTKSIVNVVVLTVVNEFTCSAALNLVVRFQILTAASMKVRVFWDVARYCIVGVGRRFTGAYCLRHQGDDSSRF